MSGASIGKKCCPMLLLARIILQVGCAAASSVLPTISFEPPVLKDLSEGSNETVAVRVQVPDSFFDMYNNENGPWNLSLSPIHDNIASVDGQQQFYKKDLDFDNATRFYTLESTFVVHGKFLGKTGVRARLVLADWKESPIEDIQDDFDAEEYNFRREHNTLDVAVKRSADSVWLTKVFVTSLVVIISLANILMGCELDMNVVLSTVRRPVAPCIGFFTQFVVMPLLAYAIAQVVFVPKGMHSFALGLFVTGCSPGGGASNFWTVLLDGNVNLSVTMTFLSTLASLVMMPAWISVLGQEFLQGFSGSVRIRVPYSKIVSSLVSLVVPLLIGVAIAKWKPQWAAHSRKIMRPFIMFVLIFVIVFGCVANSYMWGLMTGPALLGGLLLPWCGFMCGCFISIALGRSPADVTAIAIETGIQNTGIAILMLKWSFPEPDADISALIPVIVACFTPGPLLLGAAVHITLKRLQKRKEEKDLGEELKTSSTKVSVEDGVLGSFEPAFEEKRFLEAVSDATTSHPTPSEPSTLAI